MPKTVYLAADHGGLLLKQEISKHLENIGYTVQDFGTHSGESCDYPIFAHTLCESVARENHPGILICGTGIGMSMAANKCPGIRAALCANEYMARMSRRHNDANVLCLGERVLGIDLAKSIVDAFLESGFDGGRHQRRIDLFSTMRTS
jgi:ribose 5-phosphate isomerase B